MCKKFYPFSMMCKMAGPAYYKEPGREQVQIYSRVGCIRCVRLDNAKQYQAKTGRDFNSHF
jgi:hypothetical protein